MSGFPSVFYNTSFQVVDLHVQVFRLKSSKTKNSRVLIIQIDGPQFSCSICLFWVGTGDYFPIAVTENYNSSEADPRHLGSLKSWSVNKLICSVGIDDNNYLPPTQIFRKSWDFFFSVHFISNHLTFTISNLNKLKGPIIVRFIKSKTNSYW